MSDPITTPQDDDLIRRGDVLKVVTDTAVKWGVTGEPAILLATKVAIRAVAPVAVVKPLEWHRAFGSVQKSGSLGLTYRIEESFGQFSCAVIWAGDIKILYRGKSEKVAKSKAQADYAARILSALDMTAAPVDLDARIAEAVAGAYAAAASVTTPSIFHENVSYDVPPDLKAAILALTPADADAALDRIRAEAPLEAEVQALTTKLAQIGAAWNLINEDEGVVEAIREAMVKRLKKIGGGK